MTHNRCDTIKTDNTQTLANALEAMGALEARLENRTELLVRANERIAELEEHNQNAQSLNGLLELRVKELKGLLERGYSLVKPPPVQERFKNIVGKARAAWLTDVLEVLTQETKDGN